MSGPFKMKGYSYPGASPLPQNSEVEEQPLSEEERAQLPGTDKPEGYYTVKDGNNRLTKTGRLKDVTEQYEKTGNKATREAIASGSRVYVHPVSGQLSIKSGA